MKYRAQVIETRTFDIELDDTEIEPDDNAAFTAKAIYDRYPPSKVQASVHRLVVGPKTTVGRSCPVCGASLTETDDTPANHLHCLLARKNTTQH